MVKLKKVEIHGRDSRASNGCRADRLKDIILDELYGYTIQVEYFLLSAGDCRKNNAAC